jgi:hypothetical protein
MPKEIEIIFNPKDGTVEIDQIGYQGPLCENALTELFDNLGVIRNQDKKEEYHQRVNVNQG